MQRTLRAICLVILALMCLGAGTTAAFEISIVWNNTYGDEETNESAYSIIQTENGSLIFAGDTDAKGAGLADAWLVLLDEEDGALLSDSAFGDEADDAAFDVIQSDDGSIVFAGTIMLPLEEDLYHTDAWVVRINPAGEEELNQTFGGSEVNATANSIIQTSEGGYLFVGSIEGYESENTDAWMAKIDASGEEEWNSRFGGDENESAYSVIEDDEGDFLFAGYTESFEAGEADAWVVKTDTDGLELWNETFGGAGNDTAWEIFQENEQNFSFVGTTTFFAAENRSDTDAWYLRFNATGASLLEETYGGADVNATAQAAVNTPDGGLLVAGSTEDYGSGDVDAWLIKIDTSAQEEWNGALGGPLQDLARSIIRISDTSYVFAGVFNVTPKDEPPYRDAWAVRLDEVIEPAPSPSPGPTPGPAPGPTPEPRPCIPRAAIDLEKYIRGEDADEPPGVVFETDSDAVTITFTVTNTGDVDLSAVELEDDMGMAIEFTGGDDGDDVLSPGETWNYQVPMWDEPEPYCGMEWKNTATVTAEDPEGNTVTDTDVAYYAGPPCAAIDLEKFVRGEDADEPPGYVFETDTDAVTITFTVTNVGYVNLVNVVLTDPMLTVEGPTGDLGGDGVLTPGETWNYQVPMWDEPEPDCGMEWVNTATVTAEDPDGNTVTDTDVAYWAGPPCVAIDLEKYVNGEDADEPPGFIFENANDTVNITYTVTNLGEYPLENVVLTDPMVTVEGPLDDDGDDTLYQFETWNYRVRPGDEPTAGTGEHMNTATVTAQSVFDTALDATDTDVAYWTGPEPGGIPAIGLEVQVENETNPASPGPDVPGGTPVSLFFSVTNTGEVGLTSVALSADGFAASGTGEGDDGNDILDPGETWGYETSVDAVEGTQQIDAAVTAEDPDGNEVSARITVYYTGVVEEETPTEEMTSEENMTPEEEETPTEEMTPEENMTPGEEETPTDEEPV